MAKSTPRAWLCKHCNERVDPTMEMCWNCEHDREGQQLVEVAGEEMSPFATCPQCDYDLRGNLEAEVCPECGFELMLSAVQRDLYWVPSTTKLGAIAKLLRNPLRMIPIAIAAWGFFGLFYLAGEDFFHRGFYVSGPAEFLMLLAFTVAMFFTLATISGILVQGLQPQDEEQTQAQLSTGPGIVLRWMTRGWGRYLYWLAWGLLLFSILLYYSK